MDILGQSSLLVALTSLSFGVTTLSKNMRNKLFLSYAAICFVICGWSLTFFFYSVLEEYLFYKFHLLFNVWLTPFSLFFVRTLIRSKDKVSRALFIFSLPLALFFTVGLSFGFDANSFFKFLVYFFPVMVVIQIIYFMWKDRLFQYEMKKASFKRKYTNISFGIGKRGAIYFGALVVLCITVMDHIPGVGRVIPSIGNLLLIVYFFLLSHAISRQRLLNFGSMVSKFLVILCVALTLTGIYSILFAWIKDSPALFFLNSFMVSFILLMLIDPIRSFVNFFTYQLLTKKQRKLDQMLKKAQQNVTMVVGLEQLCNEVFNTAVFALQPNLMHFYTLNSDGTQFYCYRTKDKQIKEDLFEFSSRSKDDDKTPNSLLVDHILIEHCKELQRKGDLPIVLDQIIEHEIERSASRSQKEHLLTILEAMKAMDCNLIVPFTDSGKTFGFLALDTPEPPMEWGQSWSLLRIIYPYFEQAAKTLKNLEVYVRQKEKEHLASIGEMSAGLAHEIRNPLGAIKGAAQFLDTEKDRSDSKFLNIIIEEVDKLDQVVSQFLDYSKPNQTKFEIVDLTRLAKKTVEVAQSDLPKLIKLNFSQSQAKVYVKGSDVQLQQILMNFIKNSIKAIDSNKNGFITVSVRLVGRGQKLKASLDVEDNGKGIGKASLEKLFIPFYTTSPSGTGLGLSICQKIADSHFGKIAVESDPGRFTRFSLLLPFVQSERLKEL